VIVKPNEIELMAGLTQNPDDIELSLWEQWIHTGLRLSHQVKAPVCVTLGEKGALWIEDQQTVYIPTNEVEPPIDIVGAGDCFTASLMSALGAGCSGPVAVAFAHLGASIVVKKLGETGQASAAEILLRFAAISSSGI